MVLALEEEASFIVLDDKKTRKRAAGMGLNVIGTLRVLRMLLTVLPGVFSILNVSAFYLPA